MSVTITANARDAVGAVATASTTATITTSGTFPGQPGNPVGHIHAPGYPGSLTPHTPADADISVSGTATNPIVYQFKDFDNGAGGLYVPASHIRFIGCRFQCSDPSLAGATNVRCDGTDIEFHYCSFVPRVALAAQPPNGGGYTTWPTAGVGLQYAPEDINSNPNPGLVAICIPRTYGPQYNLSINAGPCLCDHCDFWGFANCITTTNTTAQLTFTDCWIHDTRYPGHITDPGGDDHGDGIGFLDGTIPPQNVRIQHCTICAEGNTNAIAAQGGTQPYHNWSVINNYMSGFDFTVIFGDGPAGGTNLIFTDNILSTEIPWTLGPAQDHAMTFRANGCQWARNKFRVHPGTAPTVNQIVQWQPSWDGYFVWADGSYHPTDFV